MSASAIPEDSARNPEVHKCYLLRRAEQLLVEYGSMVEDVSASAIPEDSARDPEVHMCYLLRRAEQLGCSTCYLGDRLKLLANVA